MRKQILVLFTFVFIHQLGFSQEKLTCKCAEIGIDTDWANSNGIECYKIEVNQIYGDASKGKKKIAAIRALSTKKSKLPPLLYLHGGPGNATLDVAQKYLSSKNWSLIRENHDIIMTDYSGTGYSEPALCEALLDSIAKVQVSEISVEAKKEKTTQFTMDCREYVKEKNIDINTFSSFQLAADADAVRQALGITQWNVYSVSYGTMVAFLTLRHFPKGVSSVVLDSPFPPNAKSFSFASTMNETLNRLQETINKNPKTAAVFPDIIGDFSKAAQRLNEHPIKIKGADINGDSFAHIMFMTFYKTKVVPLIPLALKEFATGNNELISKWLETLTSQNEYGKENDFQNMAIYCYECKPNSYDETPQALEKKYPYLKSLSGREYVESCYLFRPEHVDSSFYKAVESNVPALVLSGEFDPGTPVSYGMSAIEKLSNATFVMVPNVSHAGMQYNECTVNLVKDFFSNPNNKVKTECINDIKTLDFRTSDLSGELDKMKKK